MPRIVTEDTLYSEVWNLVCNARKKVVLISPYIGNDDELFSLLNERHKDGLDIAVYTLKPNKYTHSDHENAINHLQEFAIPVYEEFIFHAKIYYNESSMIVTSYNLSSSSDRFEIGVFIDKNEDTTLYNEVISKVRGHLVYRHQGYCINCGLKMKYNTNRVLCKDCLTSLNSYEKHFESFNYCHKCGVRVSIKNDFVLTESIPLCEKCKDQRGSQ